jgi:hypothetical protein
MNDPVRVPVGPCRCPGTPHGGGDWVDLAPRLSATAGAAAMAAMRSAEFNAADVEAALARAFLRHNITAWSFTGEPGEDGRREAVPVTNAAIDELLDWASAHEVAEKCDELYADDLMRPLLSRLAASSGGGPTAASTSATTGSGERAATPSSRSSRAATADGKPSEAPAP